MQPQQPRKNRAKPRVRLPTPVGELVGRAAEIAQLRGLPAAERLVTLVGPPGTGKTRLALAAARAIADASPELRVAFAPLALARNTDEIARLVAEALAVTLPAGADLITCTAIIDRTLEREPTLLVLDNFEQLVSAEGALTWVSSRLENVETLKVWVTSRERLRLAGERAIEVPPLSLPPLVSALESRSSEPPPGPSPDRDAEVLASDAVRMLLSRAPDLDAAAHVAALAEIALHLEGIPLALELAAARLGLMGPSELAERLRVHGAARLDLLGHGARDRSDRQATLRGAIDWSWALLSPEERELLLALSILRGPFEPELAAEIGLASSGGAASLETVQSLRDKSLLARTQGGPLVLLESVRAYGEEKLFDEAAPNALGRDARPRLLSAVSRTLARQAQELTARLTGKGSRSAFAQMERLRDHWVHALELHDTRRAELGLSDEETADIALALDALRVRLGLDRDLLRALEDLSVAGRQIDTDRVVRLARAQARLLRDRGQPREAVMSLERAAARIAIAGGEGSAFELSLLVDIGELLLAQGRFDEAREPLEDARRGAAARGDNAIVQRAEAILGLLAHGQGRLADAERHYGRALDDARRLGDARAEAHALRDLGNLCLQRGEPLRARAYYEDALEKSPGGDLRLEGVVRGNLAILHQEEGQLENAHAELRRALACLRAVGDRPFEAHLYGYLGAVHHERGQLDAAKEAYTKALLVLGEVKDLRLEGVFSAARAAVHAQRGSIGHAKNDLATAARRLEEIGDPSLLAALELHRAAVQIGEVLASGGDSRETLVRASEVLTRTETVASKNDDARFAARMLRRLLPADALVVGHGGAFFERGRERTDLGGRPTLARMLDALALARLERPSVPLTSAELLEAGWPGERVLPAAGQNRVRVALTSLRNLGLRSAIVTAEGGHYLEPTLPLQRR